MSAISLSNNNPFSNNKQHYRQQQEHNKMHFEDIDGVEEPDEEYKEYKDQDGEEATTATLQVQQAVSHSRAFAQLGRSRFGR
jgi:hypothetical protein